MAKHFDLKKQLKLHDKTLLRRLFVDEHGVLGDLDWGSVSARCIEPLVEAWAGLEHEVRRKAELILQVVNELSEGRAHRVLIEDLERMRPDLRDQLMAWTGAADRALWAYLQARDLFEEAAKFAKAEAYRGGQFANRWNSLPKVPLNVTPAMMAALEGGVRDYYHEKELRAQHCCVHHSRRANGTDYFYAYIPEWADKRLGFDANGDLTPRELSYAFHDVFIFDPNDGSLEIIAKGGQKVRTPLRRTFCDKVLSLEFSDTDPIKPCYHLDHLLYANFSFSTEPEDRIASVWVKRMRFVSEDKGPKVFSDTLDFGERVPWSEARGIALEALASLPGDRAEWSVSSIGLQLEFLSDGRRKSTTMTFQISTPNTCDLKSKPEHAQEVGTRCIRRWGILRD
jgi:hypothetical protein